MRVPHLIRTVPRARAGMLGLVVLAAILGGGCAPADAIRDATEKVPEPLDAAMVPGPIAAHGSPSAPVGAPSGPTGSPNARLSVAVPVPTMPFDAPVVFVDAVPRREIDVVRVLPHDPGAFTQGLVALSDDRLLESTGLYGASTVREVDLDTGSVLRSRDLPPDLFGEGLALVSDRLIQLTWREEVALVHGLETFDLQGTVRYQGEGWGLCYDGERLIMSDGSERLVFRDPGTFEATGAVSVTAGGRPVSHLNELECVAGRVYANVWQTDWIVEIDPGTGDVLGVIDASGLLEPEERAAADVLNGIAYRASSDTFLLTGKFWPKLFEVRFGPASDG